MRAIVNSIQRKHLSEGIEVYPAASPSQVLAFERMIGFRLPDEFREFYTTCNGFSCNEDLFNIQSLEDIPYFQDHYGDGWFYFAEYMVYLDMWGLRYDNGQYQIFHGSSDLVLTSSLKQFLETYLRGDVFQTGGIYEWQDELKDSLP